MTAKRILAVIETNENTNIEKKYTMIYNFDIIFFNNIRFRTIK